MLNGLPDLVTSFVSVDAASTRAYGDYRGYVIITSNYVINCPLVIAPGSLDIVLERLATQNIPSASSPLASSPENWRIRRVVGIIARLD